MTKLTAMLLLVAVCSQASRVFLEQREFSIPTGWEKLGRTSADEQLELIFAVKQTNVAELESQLMKVSDPRSPAYGKHLSNEEVHELVKPTAGSLSAVHTFIEGLTSKPLTPNSDLISVTVPVSVAEELLGTEYHSYRHTVSNYVAHRAQSYSLPSNVAAAVDFVSPTVRFPPMNPQPKMKAGNVGVTAQALRTMYGVDSTIGSSPKNKHAVTAFLNQHFHPGDLAKFWKTDMASVTSAPNVKEVGDGVKGLLAGVEAMLDIEYINALGANINSEFWGFSGKSPDNPQNEPFLVWLATVSNTSDADVPLIFSTSYGEDEESTTQETAYRTNTEFMKAGARGISLLFASGDSGAGGTSPKGCPGDKFVPKWPAGSPYVTGVGGTHGPLGEEAAELSSGGFCNRWATPSYQADAVKAYVSSGSSDLPPASYFNASGRGFPDISAQAEGFNVTANDIVLPGVAGTSCASPTASGVMALLNDLRLAAGKPSLGFLNPFIYQNAAAFNDITRGAGEGCGLGKQKGFSASKGWDPVTGVGTPNYKKLKQVVLKLP